MSLLASQIHYALISRPDPSTPSSAHAAFARKLTPIVVRLAKYVATHARLLQSLPEAALGAICEYDLSQMEKRAMDIENIHPLHGDNRPPERYAKLRIQITGKNDGLVKILPQDQVTEQWWLSAGTCRPSARAHCTPTILYSDVGGQSCPHVEELTSQSVGRVGIALGAVRHCAATDLILMRRLN